MSPGCKPPIVHVDIVGVSDCILSCYRSCRTEPADRRRSTRRQDTGWVSSVTGLRYFLGSVQTTHDIYSIVPFTFIHFPMILNSIRESLQIFLLCLHDHCHLTVQPLHCVSGVWWREVWQCEQRHWTLDTCYCDNWWQHTRWPVTGAQVRHHYLHHHQYGLSSVWAL